MSINRLNLIYLLNASSSNYNSDTDASGWKIKSDHEIAQIFNNIDDVWFICWMLGPLLSTNMILMLRYVATAFIYIYIYPSILDTSSLDLHPQSF